MKKTILYTLTVIFLILLQTSCSKSEEDFLIDPNGEISIARIMGTQVELHYAGDLMDDNSNRIIWGYKKKGELNFEKNDAQSLSSIEIFRDLEFSTTYEVATFFPNGKPTPYNTVEFTTLAFDNITNIEIEPMIFVNIGEEISFETDGGTADFGSSKLFFVSIPEDQEGEEEQTIIELDVTQNAANYSFIVPEEALPENFSFTKAYKLFIGQNINQINEIDYNIQNSGNILDLTFRVFNSEIALNNTRNQLSEASDNCTGERAYKVSIEGFLFESFYLFDNPHQSTVIIKNLDTNAELILSEELQDDCNNYRISRLGVNHHVHNGMAANLLSIEFIEDEAQGLVPGNYSVQVNYSFEDGRFFETNVFEFELEQP